MRPSKPKRFPDYVWSLPERVVRSVTALAGGILRETGEVVIPTSLRRSRLYQTLVESTLRFLIEQVGQVEETNRSQEQLAKDFLLRRTAGNGLEALGILAFRASPVWVMAALADASGTGRHLVREITATLQKEGLLDPGVNFETVDQMLDGLERSAGRLAETFNTPPLDVKGLRNEWSAIRREVARIPAPHLPRAETIWRSWKQLESEAETQGRTVFELSSLMALSAIRNLPEGVWWIGKSSAAAARATGKMFAEGLLQHYAETLEEIRTAGYLGYWVREFRPYLRAAALHFSPRRISMTQRLLRRGNSILPWIFLFTGSVEAQQPQRPPVPLPAISSAALKAHVSFLASDALKGRDTPSMGLEVAAEYIASQFRRAGLVATVAGGYFQVSEWVLEFRLDDQRIAIAQPDVSDAAIPVAWEAAVYKVSNEGAELRPQDIRRRVVLVPASLSDEARARIAEMKPAAIFVVGGEAAPSEISIRNDELRKLFESLPEGRTQARITSVPAGLKNVIGILPGSAPGLRDTCLLLTAHYDHVGPGAPVNGDRIYNGANDNASSVAVMLEVAAVLSARRPRPRRSIAFIAYFGEEKGLVGSRYYAHYPVIPVGKTVVQLNMEQLGRTDDGEGSRIKWATLTGFEYSDVARTLSVAAARTGIQFVKHKNSGEFFERSDNEALAKKGVPAHTLSVTFAFPDYHQPADEWEKIDYQNLSRVARFIAVGTELLANRSLPPRWNMQNETAAGFATAKQRASAP